MPKSTKSFTIAAWISILAACSPVQSPPALSPTYVSRSASSLPVGPACGLDAECWKRRELESVLVGESLRRQNEILVKERDDAREGERFSQDMAARLRKDAEPSILSSPYLWLGVGLLGGIGLTIGAAAAAGSALKAVR